MHQLCYMFSNLNIGFRFARRSVRVPRTRLNEGVLRVLMNNKIIHYYTPESQKCIRVYPHHFNRVIHFRIISTPSRRVTTNYRNLRSMVQSGRFFLVSTGFGLCTSRDCMIRRYSGQLLAEIQYKDTHN